MLNGTVPYTHLRSGIYFNNLSFSYPNHKTLVLKGIDLFWPQGTTLALVGSSGSGKSTLADLLPRFYDPTEGYISIDGTDLREYELKSLRKAMGIVSQDTFLFNASVRDNIAYARQEATDEEIVEAAKGANAYEFIEQLADGLDTQIGDRGVILSGGQRQRISIARALLQNPEILILDEATSSLDTVSERYVQEAIEKLSCNRTTLVIAHRLSTVQKADKIAVIDRGQVVEIGCHEELLTKGGYYTRLYSMQFAEETARDEALIRGSYEIRTRLTPMIAYLKLLVDEMVDSPEERDELIRESFHSAANILKTLEFIECTIKRQTVKK
jgi:ATP-binding cassette, subfamily B, bacterial MsbA